MRGFFYDSRQSRKRGTVTKGPRLVVPHIQGPVTVPSTPSCSLCRLHEGCHSPKMAVGGKGQLGVLIIAEAPGETEDTDGTQFVGRAGQVLRDRLADIGVDLDRDCWKINAINCRPPGNRTPTPKEVDWCRPVTYNAIRTLKPRVIIPLGKTALETLLAHRWSQDLEGIGRWRGWTIPDREFRAWVCPTYHPSFILRGHEGDPVDMEFCSDLTAAVALCETPLPVYKNERDCITILKTPEQACEYLDALIFQAPDLCAFDYETTGLKPYGAQHRVVCASLAPSEVEAVSFVFPKEDWGKQTELRRLWCGFLACKDIGKIASNLKFEHVWSATKFGTEPANWQWDTMVAAHVLDNRPGITSIKFQGYVQTGLLAWDQAVSPYLKASSVAEKLSGGNAVNQVDGCPLEDLLYYCAVDSLVEYRVAQRQMEIIE